MRISTSSTPERSRTLARRRWGNLHRVRLRVPMLSPLSSLPEPTVPLRDTLENGPRQASALDDLDQGAVGIGHDRESPTPALGGTSRGCERLVVDMLDEGDIGPELVRRNDERSDTFLLELAQGRVELGHAEGDVVETEARDLLLLPLLGRTRARLRLQVALDQLQQVVPEI